MPPGLLRSEDEHAREQPAKRIEKFEHRRLCRAATRRVRRVTVHPVLGDVDVKAAQIDGAKLIQRVIDLVKFEIIVRRPTRLDHLIQSFQNPAIDQSKRHPCCSGGLRPPITATLRERRYTKVVQITEQNPQRISNAAIRVAETRK